MVPNEIALMHRITPCNQVIQLIEWYERPDSYIIIMERPEVCQDLFDYITEKKHLDEDTARTFFWQVIWRLLMSFDGPFTTTRRLKILLCLAKHEFKYYS